MKVKGRASTLRNHFFVSQPGRPPADDEDDDDNRVISDMSDQFIVVDNLVEEFFVTQRKLGENDMYDTWRLGVGIGVGLGVGLGVPLFMAASFVAGLVLIGNELLLLRLFITAVSFCLSFSFCPDTASVVIRRALSTT